MKKPEISVIMAVYNCSEYLDSCIKSILNQTFKNFELIMINDCSTDNSLEIMRTYQKKDKRIIIVNNKVNSKPAVSRNNGLKIVRGKYVAIQDSDDISKPQRLEVEYEYLKKNPDVFLVGSAAEVVYSNEKETYPMDTVYGVGENEKRLVKNNHIIHSSVMFRNNTDLMYREKFYYSHDYDLFLNMLSRGLKINNLNQALVYYRINEQGISTRKSTFQKFFGMKAQEFYYQRLKFGKDDYSSFNPEIELEELKKTVKNVNAPYPGIKFLIDLVIYSNKKKALNLLFVYRKSLDVKYIIKKTILLILPKRLMILQREHFG